MSVSVVSTQSPPPTEGVIPKTSAALTFTQLCVTHMFIRYASMPAPNSKLLTIKILSKGLTVVGWRIYQQFIILDIGVRVIQFLCSKTKVAEEVIAYGIRVEGSCSHRNIKYLSR